MSTSKLQILRVNALRANAIHTQSKLQEIERFYHRLVEIEKWAVDQQQYNRPFAHFGLFNGHDARTCFAMREYIVSLSADQPCGGRER